MTLLFIHSEVCDHRPKYCVRPTCHMTDHKLYIVHR